jgi:nucleoside 2-deoxyribosyltransferase
MQPWYEKVVVELEKCGVLVSSHVADETITRGGELEYTNTYIWERERARVASADVVVADVTLPSLGVGYLIAYASSLGKRVIALSHGAHTHNLSAMIAGDKNVEVHAYVTEEALKNVLEECFS